MKSNVPPRLGMIDALGAGLSQAGRRPWLWLFPAFVDLVLWLAPRLSIADIGTRLIATWKALLPMAYSSSQIAALNDVITYAEQTVAAAGKEMNLLSMIAFGWLAPPSALAGWQPTRFTLISDGVLTPLGLGITLGGIAPPSFRPAAIEVTSMWAVMLVVLAALIVGQVIIAMFYRTAAHALAPVSDPQQRTAGRLPRRDGAATANTAQQAEPVNTPGLGRLVLRVAAVSFIAAVSAFMLTLPLSFVGLFAQMTGSGGELLMAISGGVTMWLLLWFLSALFFVGDLLVLDGAPLWPSRFQSLVFVRANGFNTLVFASLINLIMLGARAIWGMIGGAPLGALTAIVANSFLATGMLLSVFVYYRSLRRYWLAVRTTGQVSR